MAVNFVFLFLDIFLVYDQAGFFSTDKQTDVEVVQAYAYQMHVEFFLNIRQN